MIVQRYKHDSNNPIVTSECCDYGKKFVETFCYTMIHRQSDGSEKLIVIPHFHYPLECMFIRYCSSCGEEIIGKVETIQDEQNENRKENLVCK